MRGKGREIASEKGRIVKFGELFLFGTVVDEVLGGALGSEDADGVLGIEGLAGGGIFDKSRSLIENRRANEDRVAIKIEGFPSLNLALCGRRWFGDERTIEIWSYCYIALKSWLFGGLKGRCVIVDVKIETFIEIGRIRCGGRDRRIEREGFPMGFCFVGRRD